MVIASSPIAAILFDEQDATVYLSAILDDATRLMSAATLAEISMAALRLFGSDPLPVLDGLLARLQVEIVPFDREQALLARDAFRRFGKGRGGTLSYGDCFSYALAKHTREPLLFRGSDFLATDVARV
jgi:ribonuclease VapC